MEFRILINIRFTVDPKTEGPCVHRVALNYLIPSLDEYKTPQRKRNVQRPRLGTMLSRAAIKRSTGQGGEADFENAVRFVGCRNAAARGTRTAGLSRNVERISCRATSPPFRVGSQGRSDSPRDPDHRFLPFLRGDRRAG